MKNIELKVDIPEPCHEDWNNMTPTQKGKFCKVCTKEVIDFTSESDEEIVKHFQKNENVCGRFYASQLDRKLIIDRKKRNHWLSYAASLLLPIALFSQEARKNSKQTPKTEQTTTSKYTSLKIGSKHTKGKTLIKKQTDSLTVSGTITDDTGLPLPGATIIAKNTTNGVSADFDGNYKINVRRNETLVINYIGYEAVEIKASNNIHNARLEPEAFLGEVVVVGGYTVSPRWIEHTERTLTKEQKENKKRIENYFTFQKKKWKEKREKRRAKRAARKAERAAKRIEREST